MNDHAPAVLIALTDFPGEHFRMGLEFGRTLKAEGITPVFLLMSRYMERFKGLDCDSVGPTFYLHELLGVSRPSGPPAPDHWWMHASYVRQTHHVGRSLVRAEHYGPVRAAIEEVFDRTRPTLVWSEPVTNATLAIIFHVASDRGVEYRGVGGARVPGYFVMSRDYWGADLVPSGGRGVPERMPGGVPDWMRHVQAGRPEGTKRDSLSLRVVRAVRAAWPLDQAFSREIGWGPFWQAGSILRRAQRTIRGRVRRLWSPGWDSDEACLEAENTFLFPLHVRPEASTSHWARFYEYDIQTIRNLAFSLPGGATLVVKEHPAALGSRPRSFFRALKRLPRLRLLRPAFDARAEVGRFTGVLTLTSTLGFEALTQGVPVLALGRIFYEGYPGVSRARAWPDVTPWMNDAIAGNLVFDPDEAWRIYRRHIYPGLFDVRDLASVEPENVARLAAPVIEQVRGLTGLAG